jgi:hypothetical protein
MSKRTKIIFVVLIILLAAASRLIKHPFNFTPIVAMSIFAGCYLGKKWGIILPLAAMALSDVFIGFYDIKLMLFVYVSIAISYFIGTLLKNRKQWYFIISSALISSIIFFLVTNFSVWALYEWYPKTWAGLVSCFTLALPFFRNTLIGDLVYTGALFGAYEAVMVYADKKILAKANEKI